MDKRENKTRAVPRFSNRSGTTWECPWQQQQQPQSSRTPPSWWQGANRHGKITARILSPSSPSTLGDSSMATTTQLVVTTRRHFLGPTVDEAEIVALYLAVTFGTQILEVSYDIPAVIRRYCSVLRQCFPAGMNLCLGLPAGSPCSMNGGCNTTIERLMLSMKPASGGGHDELSLPLVSLMMVRQPDCICVCPYLPQRQPSHSRNGMLSLHPLSFFDTPRFHSRRSRIPVNPIHHDLPL